MEDLLCHRFLRLSRGASTRDDAPAGPRPELQYRHRARGPVHAAAQLVRGLRLPTLQWDAAVGDGHARVSALARRGEARGVWGSNPGGPEWDAPEPAGREVMGPASQGRGWTDHTLPSPESGRCWTPAKRQHEQALILVAWLRRHGVIPWPHKIRRPPARASGAAIGDLSASPRLH